MICSCDDPCLSKFGALRRGMSALRETICRTFVQHLPVLLKKHNRAKPMSELLSALISIADSSEFRFARFNIVYEGAQLVLPESPPIVSGVSDMCPPVCPNVEETRNQLQSSGWKKYAHFFPTNAPAAFLQESGMLCFLQYCLPPKNRVCLL